MSLGSEGGAPQGKCDETNFSCPHLLLMFLESVFMRVCLSFSVPLSFPQGSFEWPAVTVEERRRTSDGPEVELIALVTVGLIWSGKYKQGASDEKMSFLVEDSEKVSGS